MTPHPLIAYLFDDRLHSLRGHLKSWLEVSPRFAAFAEQHKDKIRKKIRVLNGEDMSLDLLAELEMAYLLMTEERFEVVYEPAVGRKARAGLCCHLAHEPGLQPRGHPPARGWRQGRGPVGRCGL